MSLRIRSFLFLIVLGLNSCSRYTGFESLLGLLLFGSGQPVRNENGIVLHESGGATAVIEGASTDTVAYHLAEKPASSVSLTVETSSARILLDGAPEKTLTFTGECPSAQCYENPQSITVSAVDNALADGDVTASVTVRAASSDPVFSGVSGPAAEVSVSDNDGPLSIVAGTTSLTLSEGGTSGSVSVRLSRDPGAVVTVNAACNPAEARVNGSAACPVALTFNSTNWSSPQSLTISAFDDAISQGLHTSSVVLSSPDFAGSRTVSLTLNDNDSAGAVVSLPVGGVTATEGGAGSAYSVKLTSEPTASVTLTLSYTGEILVNGSASPAVLTFTPGNWTTPQNVNITAVDDSSLAGAHSALIAHAFSGGGYAGVSVSDVSVSLTDNESAGISITESSGSTAVDEAGTTDSYTIKLTSKPSGPVTMSIAFDPAQVSISGPAGASSTSPYTFTIAASDWNTNQTMTVSAVNDTDIEGAHTASLVHTASGSGYGSAPSVTVTASIADNDSTGITVAESGGSTDVTEGSSTADTYTVKLNSAPSSNVSVSIAFAGSQVSVNGSTTSPQTLTFTPGNWNTAQTVSVLANSDTSIEGSHTAVLAHTVTSSDSSYNALGHVSAADVSAHITDNVQNAWWDALYLYRRKITFSCSHPAYTSDYTVSFTLDTTDASRFDPSGANVRIVWQPAAGSVSELNRVGYNWGSASTRIDFKVQTTIAQDVCPESPDGSYYVYYKRAGAPAAPADETAVYYFADFFNRADSTTIGSSWTEWLQNNSGTAADVLLSGGWLTMKGGTNTTFSGMTHWMEAGVSRAVSASAMTLPFRTEFDWYVPEPLDKTNVPNQSPGWARDNDFHIGFSLGDFSTTQHQSIIGGKTGDTDSWIAVNLIMGEGENSTPNPDVDVTDHGCPGSSSTDCMYFAMQPRFDNGPNPSLNRINNAPGFTHNPWNWDPSPAQSATLRLRIDVNPGTTSYDVWLNDVQRMTSLPFIAPSAPLTHVRLFQSHYSDFLSSIAFDATPPQKFDNLRIFYPADGTAGAEAGP